MEEQSEKTPWQRYKEKLGTSRPWDLLNPEIGRVTEAVQKERYEICKACPRFVALTTQCKECGCVMRAKTWLPNASCPLGKWGLAPKNEGSNHSD